MINLKNVLKIKAKGFNFNSYYIKYNKVKIN